MLSSFHTGALGLRERKSAAPGHKVQAQWKQPSRHILLSLGPCLRPCANHCPPGTGKPPTQPLAICDEVKVFFEVSNFLKKSLIPSRQVLTSTTELDLCSSKR